MKAHAHQESFHPLQPFGADWIQVGKARTDERLCWSLDDTTFDAERPDEQSKVQPA